jgi:hypothetical protein
MEGIGINGRRFIDEVVRELRCSQGVDEFDIELD